MIKALLSTKIFLSVASSTIFLGLSCPPGAFAGGVPGKLWQEEREQLHATLTPQECIARMELIEREFRVHLRIEETDMPLRQALAWFLTQHAAFLRDLRRADSFSEVPSIETQVMPSTEDLRGLLQRAEALRALTRQLRTRLDKIMNLFLGLRGSLERMPPFSASYGQGRVEFWARIQDIIDHGSSLEDFLTQPHFQQNLAEVRDLLTPPNNGSGRLGAILLERLRGVRALSSAPGLGEEASQDLIILIGEMTNPLQVPDTMGTAGLQGHFRASGGPSNLWDQPRKLFNLVQGLERVGQQKRLQVRRHDPPMQPTTPTPTPEPDTDPGGATHCRSTGQVSSLSATRALPSGAPETQVAPPATLLADMKSWNESLSGMESHLRAQTPRPDWEKEMQELLPKLTGESMKERAAQVSPEEKAEINREFLMTGHLLSSIAYWNRSCGAASCTAIAPALNEGPIELEEIRQKYLARPLGPQPAYPPLRVADMPYKIPGNPTW